MAEPANLDKVKAKVREKYEAMAKLEGGHLALIQQVKTLLTPEQRQRMESMMMEMGPMMGASAEPPPSDEGPENDSGQSEKAPAQNTDSHGY